LGDAVPCAEPVAQEASDTIRSDVSSTRGA
jgi:hypothetical protein